MDGKGIIIENNEMSGLQPDTSTPLTLLVLEERYMKTLKLMSEIRLLSANECLENLKRELSLDAYNSAEFDDIKSKVFTQDLEMSKMEQRAKVAKEVLETGDVLDDTWIFGVTLFGITTHYKKSDDGLLLLRLEGSKDNLPLFEQLAVVHEVDLYPSWIPFCNYSQLISTVTNSEIVAYFSISFPFFSRETALHVYSVDCLHESGTVLLIGESIDDWLEAEIPWHPIGWFHNKLIIKEFKAIVKVNSPSAAKITVIASVDPRSPLPQFILNFILQKFAGILLYCMQNKAAAIVADPYCTYADRIRSNTEFYTDFILRKLNDYCDYMGWELPVINSMKTPPPPPPVQQGTSNEEEEEEEDNNTQYNS